MQILIADDHALFRSGLRLQLKDIDPDATILEAADFTQMLDIARQTPDLDLISFDIGMPGVGWRDALTQLKKLSRARLVILSGSDGNAVIREAMSLGASGFLPKSDEPHVMIAALKLVLSGGTYVPLSALAAQSQTPARANATLHITERQMDVLMLMAQGHSNKEIAYRLNLTEGTVKLHVAAILKSLGATNRTQAVLAAQEACLID